MHGCMQSCMQSPHSMQALSSRLFTLRPWPIACPERTSRSCSKHINTPPCTLSQSRPQNCQAPHGPLLHQFTTSLPCRTCPTADIKKAKDGGFHTCESLIMFPRKVRVGEAGVGSLPRLRGCLHGCMHACVFLVYTPCVLLNTCMRIYTLSCSVTCAGSTPVSLLDDRSEHLWRRPWHVSNSLQPSKAYSRL